LNNTEREREHERRNSMRKTLVDIIDRIPEARKAFILKRCGEIANFCLRVNLATVEENLSPAEARIAFVTVVEMIDAIGDLRKFKDDSPEEVAYAEMLSSRIEERFTVLFDSEIEKFKKEMSKNARSKQQ